METVEIGGKQYVSAKAAARAHGYTMDYIGQLIRGGKLSGSKVGRAWYVDVDSLAAYTGEQKISTPAVAPAPAPVQAPKPVVLPTTQDAVETVPQEKVAPVVSPPIAPVMPAASVAAVHSRPTVKEARELNEVFGMRYIPDEEPMLPLIPEKTLVEAKIEHPVAVRAIHAPMYTPTPAQVAPQTEPQKTVPATSYAAKNAAQPRFAPQLDAQRAPLQLPLQKLGFFAACAVLVLIILSGAFLERTISVQGEQQTAGVSFSAN